MAAATTSSAGPAAYLTTLKGDLEAAQLKFEEMIEAQTRAMDRVLAEHGARVRQLQDQVESLRLEASSTDTRAEAVRHQLQAEMARLSERRSELEALRTRAAALPAELDRTVAAERSVKAEVDELRAELGTKESSLSYQLRVLQRGVRDFAPLGLRFDRIPGDRLRVTFTSVDPLRPAREFSFALHVSEVEVYTVSECVPPIPELPALVEELNRSNDFSSFVQAMRAAFKARV